MNPAETPDDATLLAELRDMLWRADPVPARAIEAARNSFDWRTLDLELAQLTADSSLATADVRGEPARLLSYEAGSCSIDVEVGEIAGRLRILGQLVPPQAARLRVEQPVGSVEVTADEMGRFTVRDLPPGPTRFVVESADPATPGTGVHTDWVRL
ncbi:hypothetical protein AB0I61_14740 [Polymorphospora rubra]|uniref:hypothetical protein n=1 Tax=Polymorphospora rubra TaxID=338584 RepID=UPI0033CE4C3A